MYHKRVEKMTKCSLYIQNGIALSWVEGHFQPNVKFSGIISCLKESTNHWKELFVQGEHTDRRELCGNFSVLETVAYCVQFFLQQLIYQAVYEDCTKRILYIEYNRNDHRKTLHPGGKVGIGLLRKCYTVVCISIFWVEELS